MVKNCLKKFSHKIFLIISFALLQSSYFNFLGSIQIILIFTKCTQITSSNRHGKVKCDNCGTQTTKPIRACHKRRCSVGTLYCCQCPNFSTKLQSDLFYHIAKKHSVPQSSKTYNCKLCRAEFPGFFALRQHKNTQHGTKMGLGASDILVDVLLGVVDDRSLRERLESCNHFLTDTEMEN